MIATHLRDHVVVPVLRHLGPRYAGRSAMALLLGIAAVESDMGRYLVQVPAGPARGPWQMEPDTHRDLWTNWLAYRPEAAERLGSLRIAGLGVRANLTGNLLYACAAARLQLYRAPAPLPAATDIAGLAAYWKRYWNTPAGAGTQAGFRTAWAAHGVGAVLEGS